jgi:hypothetical protein
MCKHIIEVIGIVGRGGVGGSGVLCGETGTACQSDKRGVPISSFVRLAGSRLSSYFRQGKSG